MLNGITNTSTNICTCVHTDRHKHNGRLIITYECSGSRGRRIRIGRGRG